MITKVPQAMVPAISKIATLFRKRTALKVFDTVEGINKNRDLIYSKPINHNLS